MAECRIEICFRSESGPMFLFSGVARSRAPVISPSSPPYALLNLKYYLGL